MKTWFITFVALATGFGAHASSFVGNGGSQGDVELLITVKQIQETFEVVDRKSDSGTS